MKALLAAAAAALVLGPTAAGAQTRLFSEETPVTATLEAPFAKLVRGARNNTDPYPARLTVAGAAPVDLEVAPRGLTRRTGGICTFPPLRLDFKRAEMRGTLLEGQNKLKLVAHCKPQPSFEQLLVLEYTAYRLYNAVTPMSFRVRPLQVTYTDTEGRRDDGTRFAFLIEDADDMARRNGRVEFEVAPNEISSAQLDPQAAAVYGLFQYMIGNLDWEYVAGPPGDTCCHNNKLIGRQGATAGHIPVPYDFDFSGFVDAPYATPPDVIPVRDVRTRYYRGLCRFNDQVPAAVTVLQGKRAAFNAVLASETRLTPANRANAQRYLDDFFETVADPNKVQREIIRRCR
jgi:hypothetical protein